MPLFGKGKIEQSVNFQELNKSLYTADKSYRFITIAGVTSSPSSTAKTWSRETIEGEKITVIKSPYKSKSVISNVLDLFSDMKRFKRFKTAVAKPPAIPTSSESKFRHDALYSIVKNAVLKNDDTPIIILAISHGSVIAHATLLRLMTDLQITREHMNKISVITLGSPQYIPPGLLMPIVTAPVTNQSLPQTIPRVINTYNIHDNFIFEAWYAVLLPYRRVPSKNLLRIATNKLGELVQPTLESTNVYIKSVFDPLSGFVFTDFSDLYKEALTKGKHEVELYAHSDTVNFIGVIDDNVNILDPLPEKMRQVKPGYKYTLLDFIYKAHKEFYITTEKYNYEGTGGSKNQGCSITYLPTKKVYKVRQNSDKKKYIIMNKNKVYLKDIKGKFRYIK